MADDAIPLPGLDRISPFVIALFQPRAWRPQTFLVGPPSSGKSAMLDLIRELARHGGSHG